MQDYKHAITEELTKKFLTYKALTFIYKQDISSSDSQPFFFRFFLFLELKFMQNHVFERMTEILCAMEITPPPADAETAYAATEDHHLFLLTVNNVIAAAIQGNFLPTLEFWRYDDPGAFLQNLLPTPYYGRLPVDLPEPCGGAYVKILRCIYGVRISNKIFDDDHTRLLLSLGYCQFVGDPRKFKITCPNNPNTFVIINTHVDNYRAILSWRSKYEETLQALRNRYPGL